MPPDCHTFPSLTIHEVLHAFGFGHDEENHYSIMYPYGGSACIKESNKTRTIIETGEVVSLKNEIDRRIVSCLKYIYSNMETGSCDDRVVFMQSEMECPQGYYPSTNDENNCCLEPNMKIVDGYCEY